MFPIRVNSDGVREGSLNFTVFSEFFPVYTMRSGFMGSQVMWNIILFIPMGLLLPLAFPKRLNRCWKLICLAAFISLTIECIQYFIGRSADIDDWIANTAGALIGYSAVAVGKSALGKGDAGFTISLKFVLRASLVSLAVIILAFIPFAILDYINASTPYGLFRYAHVRLPFDRNVMEALPNEEIEFVRYEYVVPDMAAQCEAMAEALNISGEMQTIGESIYISDTESNTTLTVFPLGIWALTCKNNIRDEDITAQINIIESFLQEGEYINSVEQLPYDVGYAYYDIIIDTPDASILLVGNHIDVTIYEEGGYMIWSNVTRAEAVGTEVGVSPQKAYRDATFLGIMGYKQYLKVSGITEYTQDIKVNTAQPKLIYASFTDNKILPYYCFLFVVNDIELVTYVDAVKR